MNQVHSCITIDIGDEEFLYNMAFDGCYYYGTIRSKCSVVQLNCCFEVMNVFNTDRQYINLTYDSKECVFWATAKRDGNTLYKLDCSMNEIQSYPIADVEKFGYIVGIAYNECFDNIVVAYNKAVVTVCKSNMKSTVIYTRRSAYLTGVSCLSPMILISIVKDHKTYIQILSGEEEKNRIIYVNTDMVIKSIFHHSCEGLENCFILDLFAVRKSICCICQWSITEDILGFHPSGMRLLRDNKDRFQHDYSCSDDDSTSCSDDKDVRDKSCCNDDNCLCYEDCCSNSNSCGSKRAVHACADMIKSIALVESAIANILESENEKIRRVVEETKDIKLILLVNREANKTIENLIHLEHTLYEKLSILLNSGFCKTCHCRKADDNICDCDVDGGEL